MLKHYKLVGTRIQFMADLLEWGKWLQDNEGPVFLDDLKTHIVSTIFLGLDHNFDGSYPLPLLFETMIFDGEWNVTNYQVRSCTWIDAKAQHEIAVNICKKNDSRELVL